MKRLLFVLVGVLLFSLFSWAKDVEKENYNYSKDLPTYIVITAENTKILGGIGIHINKKKSKYKEAFQYLEYYLHKDLKVRTITDLLNAMDEIGFEYQNAFSSSTGSLGVGDGKSSVSTYGDMSKVRYNVVFKKKKKN
ncbi:hypothetical protein EMN47_18410 [Prolixibacteraceae bacterium JC049]|nr:hypothetical protein [Prolixibacteraceae bacterium JC049]